MVKASPLDMALSDIISSKRTPKTRAAKRPIKKAAGAGIKKRRSSGVGAVSTPRRQSGGARRSSSGENNKRLVRINISNLAGTVLSSDLEELFQSFQLRKVSVNFNEDGTPAGTGDITLSKYQADRLIEQYAGVALDGKTMNFAVIETNAKYAKPAVRNMITRRGTSETTRPIKKRSTPAKSKSPARPPAKKSQKKPKREPKVQKTAAELDAELDAYMAR